jgi:hypothetical protein
MQRADMNLKYDSSTVFVASSLLRLLFDPEEGVRTFLRNIGGVVSDYKVSRPRSQYFISHLREKIKSHHETSFGKTQT